MRRKVHPMLITHYALSGDAPVAAELSTNIDTGERTVILYIGDAVMVSMPVQVADAIGDALADADAIVTLTRGNG